MSVPWPLILTLRSVSFCEEFFCRPFTQPDQGLWKITQRLWGEWRWIPKGEGFFLPPGDHTWLPLPRGLSLRLPLSLPPPPALLLAAHCFTDTLASCFPESITAIGRDFPTCSSPLVCPPRASAPDHPAWLPDHPQTPLASKQPLSSSVRGRAHRLTGLSKAALALVCSLALKAMSGAGLRPHRSGAQMGKPAAGGCPCFWVAPQHGSCAVPGLLPRLLAQDSSSGWRERQGDGHRVPWKSPTLSVPAWEVVQSCFAAVLQTVPKACPASKEVGDSWKQFQTLILRMEYTRLLAKAKSLH